MVGLVLCLTEDDLSILDPASADPSNVTKDVALRILRFDDSLCEVVWAFAAFNWTSILVLNPNLPGMRIGALESHSFLQSHKVTHNTIELDWQMPGPSMW